MKRIPCSQLAQAAWEPSALCVYLEQACLRDSGLILILPLEQRRKAPRAVGGQGNIWLQPALAGDKWLKGSVRKWDRLGCKWEWRKWF